MFNKTLEKPGFNLLLNTSKLGVKFLKLIRYKQNRRLNDGENTSIAFFKSGLFGPTLKPRGPLRHTSAQHEKLQLALRSYPQRLVTLAVLLGIKEY